MSLLDRLTKAAGWEVYLTSVTFGHVVAQPVLQKRGAIANQLITLRAYFLVRGVLYFRGAGQSALNRNPSRACTMASSRVIASTAPLLAVYAN